MADRYWVGGTGTWDASSTANWASTSGGTPGASVPTTTDNVFFDANSGTGTITISTSPDILNFSATGTTLTFAATGTQSFTCYSFIADSGITLSSSGTINLNLYGSSSTLSIANTANLVGDIRIYGTVTLGSSITTTISNSIFIVQNSGTFDTNGFNLDVGYFTASGSPTISITNSNVTLRKTEGWTVGSSANLTVSTGSSIFLRTGAAFNGGGKTYGSVTFTAPFGWSSNYSTISGTNTFSSLTLVASSNISAPVQHYTFNNNQTISSLSASSSGKRILIQGSGVAKTLTVSSTSLQRVDFQYITAAGTASPFTGTSIGDAGNNSNITFTTAKTVYWNLSGLADWDSTGWATTSGGTPASANYPLPQDTAVIDNSSAISSIDIEDGTILPNISVTRTSGSFTLNFTGGQYYYACGDITLSSVVTLSSAATTNMLFSRTGNITVASAGKTFPVDTMSLGFGSSSNNFILSGAFTTPATVSVRSGGINLNGATFTCSTMSFEASTSITSGGGNIVLSGTGTVWSNNSSFTKTGLLDITLSNNNNSISRTVQPTSPLKIDALIIGGATGTGVTTVLKGSFGSLSSAKTVAHTINVSGGNVSFDSWNVSGTAGNVVTLVGGQPTYTFDLANITGGINYLSVSNVNVSTANLFYVGNQSTDGGGNTNVYFSFPPSPTTGNFFLLFGG